MKCRITIWFHSGVYKCESTSITVEKNEAEKNETVIKKTK